MSLITPDPRLPQSSDMDQLRRRLYDLFREIATLTNKISNGEIGGTNYTVTAAPTSGTHQQGDFAKNSNPTELGAVASKYVVMGWVCVASGTPGTWRESRTLTGN